ncbi:MAG: hypothetical protein CMN30_17120 [Sandaracinus sp.]|nr:hypothetical protein [Sandaracinus sp.]|tara:strand:+ start:1304 stop:2680 length:1377 start_codon:yes stop_codon:yes gene_type:complete
MAEYYSEEEPATSKRLLLAENDAGLARVLAIRLDLDGWDVTTVNDGEAALEVLRDKTVDVVLLDLRLPRMDGMEVLKRIAKGPSAPRVVLMSGYLDSDNTLDAIRAGATEVLQKPVEPARLLGILEELARNRPRRAEGAGDLGIIGRTSIVGWMRDQIAEVARFPEVPVLILGETGTGKELVARAIHERSGSKGQLVAVNCAALPEHLFESELFGHVSGAFTGARTPKAGLLETAGEGTIFLDEIGELPLSMQTKLLRVLETRSFRRVGANYEQPLRARIVSATNRELVGLPGEPLRTDLFFRLAGYTIRTPALRERIDDVPLLCQHFLREFQKQYHSEAAEVSEQALCALRGHEWPGNVRELRTVLMTAMIGAGPRLEVRHVMRALGSRLAPPSDDKPISEVRVRMQDEEITSMAEVERETLERAYSACNGNLSSTARKLEMPRSTLRDRLKRHGIL